MIEESKDKTDGQMDQWLHNIGNQAATAGRVTFKQFYEMRQVSKLMDYS